MDINKIPNIIRVGKITISDKSYIGGHYVLYSNKLKLTYDVNFPIKIKNKQVSLIYFFVVNGKIYKIGQSSTKSGISGCMNFYLNAGQDASGSNRFSINYLIRNEIANGNEVEVYMKYMDMIEVNVEGLYKHEIMKVPVSAKCMEDIALNEYLSIEGKYPEWNYQEMGIPLPDDVQMAYAKYTLNRKKK